MMAEIRAVLYGMGAMNSKSLPMLLEKGVNVVGAIARSPEKVGKDVGEVANLGRKLGVMVGDDAPAILGSRSADIALVATSSYIKDIADQLELCARAGVNAITLAEEASHPWRTSPTLTAQLDHLAVENGVTLTGSGYQDVFMINMVNMLLGATIRIESTTGLMSFNLDDYGPEVARHYQIGSTEEEFAHWLKDADRPPPFGRNVLDAITTAAGLSVKCSRAETRPDLASAEVHCESLDVVVPTGGVIGFTDVDFVETYQGPVFRLEVSGRIYAEGETDVNEWTVTGEPDLRLVNPAVPTESVTCTQWVNRIPDVINARPGFVTVAELPILRYRPYPLVHYLEHSP